MLPEDSRVTEEEGLWI